MKFTDAPVLASGYCQCGCGFRTKPAPCTDRAVGWIKGEPLRYLKGHQARKPGPDYLVHPTTGCWIWQRQRDRYGYGVVRLSTTRIKAHRAVYEQHRGPIAEGLELDHLCRTPACVNPDHLEPVTHAENLRRGRHAKLNAAEATAIRESAEPYRVLADRYGITTGTVSNIKRGWSWR